MSARLSMATFVQAIPTVWKVGFTAVLIAGSVAGMVATGPKLLQTPALLARHDSVSHADADSARHELREMVKQQKLTNCILLGLESKLACEAHSH